MRKARVLGRFGRVAAISGSIIEEPETRERHGSRFFVTTDRRARVHGAYGRDESSRLSEGSPIHPRPIPSLSYATRSFRSHWSKPFPLPRSEARP